MTRMILTDAQWSRIEPHCLGKASDPGRTGGDARLFIEAVLWIARTGSPWRDLPEVFGNWNTVFKRFRHWVKADVFKRIFDALSGDPDLEFAMVDGTIVKVHRHGQGAKGGLRARPSASPEGLDHQDPRADRRARQPGALRAAPRAALRHGGRRAAHRGCRLRRADRRQGLRRRAGSSPSSTRAARRWWSPSIRSARRVARGRDLGVRLRGERAAKTTNELSAWLLGSGPGLKQSRPLDAASPLADNVGGL